MSLVDSTVKVDFQDQEVTDKNGNVQLKRVKLTRRFYPCRPQVLERRVWKKFGEVENVPRGQHKKGDFAQNETVKFENDGGDIEEELDMVKQLRQFGKESNIMKTLKK